MCSTDVYCSKQTGSSSTKGNHHPSFLRFWNWAEENCRCSQNLAAQKMLLKQKPSKHFVNGLLQFYYFRHLYSAGSCYLCTHNNCMSCPSIWATLSTLLINILLGSFQLFLHSDQPLSEGEIIPFSGVCQSGGGAALSTPEAVVASRTDWQTALMCNRRRPAATSITRRASFSTPASLTPSCILHRAQQHHAWLASAYPVIAAFRQLPVLWHFVALGFVGNGVITVMINSPWQADGDADNQSGDNRGDSAHTSISDRSARFAEFCNQAVSLMLERSITGSARQVIAQILLQRSIAWRISPRSIMSKAPRSLICCNATASWLFGEKSFR